MSTPASPGTWRWWHTALSLAMVAAVVALAVWAAMSETLVTDFDGRLPLWTFLSLAALLTAFSVLMGWGITGHLSGVLVEPKKNRMSLSRLQMLIWTILILAAYLTAFVANMAAGRENPLSVAIPGELLLAMGISITSLVGTKLVLGYKQTEHGTLPELVVSGTSEGAEEDLIWAAGAEGEDARAKVFLANKPQWRDVFQGDTYEGHASLDLGKIQLFYITIALVLGYGIEVARQFVALQIGTDGGIGSLPAIDEAFVALLALSHAGYLTTKAAS